jgi:carboxypeptidase PM20D1
MTKRLAESLSLAVQIPTISNADPLKEDREVFLRFQAFLEQRYPTMYRELEIKRFGDSLLYKWKGEKEEAELILAHYDVVPHEGQGWTTDPFGGEITGEHVIGRGTLDDKGNCILLHEAIESLLAEGFKPKKTIYLAIGADEEVGGRRGAVEMAAYLKEIGAKIHTILDEGGAVTVDVIEGARKPLALIGLAEKGSTNFKLTLRGSGGHSSMPPPKNVIGEMADIIAKIDDNPAKVALTSTVQAMFETMAPYIMGVKGKLLGRIKKLFPVVSKILVSSPTTNSLVRTTTTVTMVKGGNAPNVIPAKVEAIVNARILQGDSVEKVSTRLRELIGDKAELEVALHEEPSKVTPHDTQEFELLKDSIEHIFGDVVVVPYLMSGGSDARHYQDLSEHIFRFSPVVMTKKDVASVHSADEMITLDNLDKGYAFFRDYLMQRSMR